MNDFVKAWQCIGCGKIEAPQTCVGICQDRKVEFVYASDYKEVLAELAVARHKAEILETVARRLACTKPHDNAWEHSYRAMQEQARVALAAATGSPTPGGSPHKLAESSGDAQAVSG
jgi:hypothetical protein